MRTIHALLTAGLVVASSGCLMMTPPARNGGAAISANNIEVSVLRQSCSQTQEPDEYGWDLVEETVEVQVRNGSTEPATIHRDRFRLLTADGYALRTVTWGSADALPVAGRQDQTFELRFMTRGSLECHNELRLDPDAGITLRDSPVAFQPVSFVPQRRL